MCKLESIYPSFSLLPSLIYQVIVWPLLNLFQVWYYAALSNLTSKCLNLTNISILFIFFITRKKKTNLSCNIILKCQVFTCVGEIFIVSEERLVKEWDGEWMKLSLNGEMVTTDTSYLPRSPSLSTRLEEI